MEVLEETRSNSRLVSHVDLLPGLVLRIYLNVFVVLRWCFLHEPLNRGQECFSHDGTSATCVSTSNEPRTFSLSKR